MTVVRVPSISRHKSEDEAKAAAEAHHRATVLGYMEG